MVRVVFRRFILGFAILGVLLSASSFFSNRFIRIEKNLDQYWNETNLGSAELEVLLDKSACFSERKAFLACVNAINRMGERFGMRLSTHLSLVTLSQDDLEEEVFERQELAPFEQNFKNGIYQESDRFLGAFQWLDKNKIPSSDRSAVIASGLNGFFSVYQDPHTYIIPIAYYEEVVAQNESRQYQFGFVSRRINGKITIRKVFDNSPAQKAGLKRGDVILRVNHRSTATMTMSQFLDTVRSPQAQRLSFALERSENGQRSRHYVEMMRSEFYTPSVTSRVLGDERDLGLLTLHRFARGTCHSATKELEILKAKRIRGLLLDLRDNPGGQVEEASCVINLFVEQGTLAFETRYLNGAPADLYYSDKDPLYRGPLAVLINGGSASAAEIVAGSLKDLNRATIVGERSFGKGSFQDGRVWGAYKKIAVFETQGMYFFPSGWTPQLTGIEPDLKVAMGATEEGREEVFYNPLVPTRSFSIPKPLALLKMFQCETQPELQAKWMGMGDAQLEKASLYLSCGQDSSAKASGLPGI